MADALTATFTKRFPGGTVIRGELNQSVHVPSVTVLFGPSGCGKTTLLRCLAGLERPEEGTIQFGRDVWFDAVQGLCLPPPQRGVGLVFQEYALFPHLTVEGNIAYGLRRLPGDQRHQRVADLLDRFGLRGLEQRRPRQLSGGQQQRVALARALACRPRLLLLDEPLAALDATSREELRRELRHSLAACGIPVLLVTHDREEALALGDTLVVMSAGRVLQAGPVLEVFNRPANVEVAGIVGVETLQPGRVLSVSNGLATVEVGAARLVALAPGGDVRDVLVCVRGEDVVLQRDGGGASSVRNRLSGRVVAVHAGVPLMRVELDVGFLLRAFVTRPAIEELGLSAGEAVTALIKAPAVHLIPRAR